MNQKKQIVKQILSLLMALALIVSMIPISAISVYAVENSNNVVIQGSLIIANGTPLLITGNGSRTTIYIDSNKNGIVDNGELSLAQAGIADAPENNTSLYLYKIIGGAYDSDFSGDTHIVMTGGYVGSIYGGNVAENDTNGIGVFEGTSYIEITGGTINEYVVAGNYNLNKNWSANYNGNSTVIIARTANVRSTIYGRSRTDVKFYGTSTGFILSDTADAGKFNNGIIKTDSTNYTAKGTAEAPLNISVTIAEGETMTVKAGANITINGKFVNNGTLIIEEGATLTVTGTNNVNNGTITNNGTINCSHSYSNDCDNVCNFCSFTRSVSHNWQNASCDSPKTCLKCGGTEGVALGHSLQYSASDNVITETCKNNCGHSETATLSLDTTVSLNYTGSEIKPLKVEYSDGWQGGTLDIAYQNNIVASTDVSKASGSITKNDATATLSFTITKATMSGISVNGYSGVYDGKEHSISITNVPSDATVKYSTSENGTYTTTNPTYTEKGTYEVWYKIEKENYETVSGSASVVISQATNSWTTDPSIAGWTYGETAKTSSAAAKFGTVKVEYRLATETDADYTTEVPTEAGSYLVRFSVEGNENYTSLSEVVELKIAQVKLTVTADNKSKTYGESDPTLTWQITEGNLAGSDMLENISISREEGNDANSYGITVSQTEGANPNYDITFKGGTFTIYQKEIGIEWGGTQFMSYTGRLVLPKVMVSGLADGDNCEVIVSLVETVDGAGINPGQWTAKITGLSNGNYKLPENGSVPLEVSYTIYAQQTKPVVTGVGETIKGKNDGYISGLTTEMEYATEPANLNSAYTKITDPNMSFAPGTYYVRYASKDYHYSSSYTEVTIAEGIMLTITLPATQTGYTVTTVADELEWNGNTTLTFDLANGYSKTEAFAVKVNGDKVELDTNGQYVITNAQENITVTVDGVKDITAPTAEITLGTNKWNSFFNTITFGLFFKETQSVTVSAEDVNTGSGIDKVYYYLSSEELTEDEVKALADWKEYDSAFSINPNNEYIIYAKAVDKVGNATYISSEYGIVLDAVVPVITGVDNNATYYGDTEFGVDETYMDTVTVDGNTVDLTDSKYTIVADGKEHTIVAVDKAGNSSATVKITVITIASLDDTIEDIKTTDVKSSDKEDIQEVLDFVNSLIDSEKDFTDAEDKQLSDIKNNAESLLKQISDTEAEVKYLTDKVGAYEEAKVTTDDKADLEKAKDDLEKALEDYKDNLTEDEKKAIEDKIKGIDELLKVIENMEKEANAPKTGNFTNIWMLFALMFVSGMSILGITVRDKKRR